MLRKALRAIGWIAAGLVALCVIAYLGVLAINWRDQPPNAAANRLAQMFRERPVVADADNAYVYLRDWKLDPDRRKKLSPRLQEFLAACQPGQRACTAAFDAADGLFNEWHAADSSLLDRYAEFTARSGWYEANSLSITDSLPAYSGASDGQKLLLLRARELARQGDAAAVRALLEHDLQFWRTVLQSSDILISKMIATVTLTRHFEWGSAILRSLPAARQEAAIPDGWRRGISDAERSILRVMAGEWMFSAETTKTLAAAPLEATFDAEYLPMTQRILWIITQPMLQQQDTDNRYADLYWQIGQTFEVPLADYEAAVRRADDLTQLTAEQANAGLHIYNFRGLQQLASLGSFSQYAVRVSDIEGVRRAALLGATLRAAGVTPNDMTVAVANADLRNPYTDRPFTWNATERAIVFRGLTNGERGEHLILY
jgi:hypothetical protein